MKKIILLVLLSISLFAQQNGKLVGGGAVWTDSLGYGTGAAGTSTASDSVFILNIDFAYNNYRIFIKGNSNTTVDSVECRPGTIRYLNNGIPIDTVWGSRVAFQDSAGNTIYTIINNTVGKDFTLTHPATQLLKFSLLNYRAAKKLRNTALTISAKK